VWLGIAPRKSAAEAAPRGDRPARSVPPAPVLTFYQDLTAPLTPAPLPPRPKPAGAERAVPAPPLPGRDERGGAMEGARFTIQVGAYRTRDAAEALQARLVASGHEAYIAESEAPDGSIRYRVRVGSFVSQEGARAAAAKLATERQLSTYVTTR
jgi:cell division protein FtsN